MNAFLPPSTNIHYRGSPYSAWFLAFYGIAWIVPGMIHSFLPDGGAGVIAGLDLSHNPTMIFGMFAWAGATQIAHGIVTLLVALRYRALVPLLLSFVLVYTLMNKDLGRDHRPRALGRNGHWLAAGTAGIIE